MVKYTYFIILMIFFLLVSFQKDSMAGPPFFTDDPEPVEYKHGEAYVASMFISDKDGRAGTLPHFEFNYGVWPDLQAHIIAPFVFTRPNGMPTSYGYGDTELGLKYRFVQETKWQPQIGTFPLLELPTGDTKYGLGNGKAQVFIPIFAQKSWGPWTTYGGGGYWFNPGEGNKNWTFLGWLLQRDFSEKLTLGAEIFYRTPDKVDEEYGIGLNAGGFLNFTSKDHLLFSAGTDLHGPRRATIYIAYLRTF